MAWQLVGAVLENHPALPERQFRVLLALAHAAPVTTRRAAPGLPLIQHQANCAERTARRALEGLTVRGLIKPVGGHGGRGGQPQLYELTGVEPVWANGDPAATQVTAVDPAVTQMAGETLSSGHPGDRSTGGQPGPASGHSGPIQRPPMGGRSHRTDTDRQNAPAPARDPDAQPDWQRGPALEGRVLPPGARPRQRPERPAAMRAGDRPPNARDLCPRGCGKAHGTGPCPLDATGPPSPGGRSPGGGYPTGPMPWAGPRANPRPDVARRGAALAKQAMAERERPADAEPPRPRTDDERRALARRQAAAARADRPAPAAEVPETAPDLRPPDEPGAEPWDLQPPPEPPDEPPPEEPPAADPPDPEPDPGWLPDDDPW